MKSHIIVFSSDIDRLHLESYLNQGFLGWECSVNRVPGLSVHSLAQLLSLPPPLPVTNLRRSRAAGAFAKGEAISVAALQGGELHTAAD